MITALKKNVCTTLLAALLLNGCKQKDVSPAAEIAVSNSYLYAIVRDLCGEETELFCIVPPGMCPGHFDIKPSDVRRLFSCRLLLAFDYQNSIEQVLPEDGRGPKYHTVTVPPGMCVPETYLTMTRQTAEILIVEYPERESAFRERLEAIAERIAALEAECSAVSETLNLRMSSVLTSRHQAMFAEWLGLEVVSTFSGGDTETAANINAVLGKCDGQTPRWIIANRQEGTQLAEALSARLGAPTAEFSNFPAGFSDLTGRPAFDALVRDNLRRLIEAAQ